MFLWGSNAREAHPIWFHHLLKGVHSGARLYVMDPRRTTSAQWADVWLGLRVGTDIALSNAVAREILHAGLHDPRFIAHATRASTRTAEAVEPYTLERGSGHRRARERSSARRRTPTRAPNAMICWTLGITEHHNAVDNVLALINLCLLTGHVGKWGSGCNPLRGQNNVQGGGDMGAIPNRLPGFQDILDPDGARALRAPLGPLAPRHGWNLTEMLDGDGARRADGAARDRREPRAVGRGHNHVEHLLQGLDHLVVQEIFLTRTAELADVVLPAAATWCEGEGTVTNSERRVQRVRKALDPPAGARDELWILAELARRTGADFGHPTRKRCGTSCARSRPPSPVG